MASTQSTSNIPGIRTRLFTANEYYRLIETGILQEDERVELLRGEIILMDSISSRHAACLNRFNFHLSPIMVAQRAIVSIQNPIHLDDYSVPQPDLVIALFRSDFYKEHLPSPSDILLLAEVADSSEEFDRSEKLPQYAHAGVTESWLINLNLGQIEAYHTPSPEGYRDMHLFIGEERLSPAAFPDFSIAVSDLIVVP